VRNNFEVRYFFSTIINVEREGVANQEAVLPMSGCIVLEGTTRSMLYPQPVSHAVYSNAGAPHVAV
jgi:hypothetical protein